MEAGGGVRADRPASRSRIALKAKHNVQGRAMTLRRMTLLRYTIDE